MQGDGDGFKPNEYMTRAMAVTLLWRACGQPEAKNVAAFSDVPAESWYAPAVDWGVESGLIKGVEEQSFAPDEYISREQFIALIVRYAQHRKFKLAEGFGVRAYCDGFRISPWAEEYVSALLGAGFISANDTSAFRPLDSMTRAEAAEMLVWYFEMENNKRTTV